MRFPPIALGIVSLLLAVRPPPAPTSRAPTWSSALAAAPESPRPSFAGRSLAGLDLRALDLHGVDFTSADLSGADLSDADLRGAKLVATKLTGAKLRRAKLNLAWIMRADFSHADLSQSILETLVASAGMETLPDEAAKFVGANLSGAKMTARFSLDDMRGAGRGSITKIQVAALLRDYDIRPVVIHPTKRADCSRHGYRAAQFEDAFARFLPHEPNIRTLKSGREKM